MMNLNKGCDYLLEFEQYKVQLNGLTQQINDLRDSL